VVWLTGLSGAGKSTIATLLRARLQAQGCHCALLDGDQLRQGINRDLGFSPADRAENVRRAAEIARLMADAGLIVIAAFISPMRAERALARTLVEPVPFLEVHVDTPLAVAEARDVKGLYRRARQGDLPLFTGIGAPYEVPEAPDLHLDTTACPADQSAGQLAHRLRALGWVA
jgi:bifunctional enzyme CysN/CysC